jgi:hypothetical protein
MPLLAPHVEKEAQGGYRQGCRMEEAPRLAVHLHTELSGEIYRIQGELLRSDSLVLQPMLRSWYRLVRAAGGELAREGGLSAKTAAVLDRPRCTPAARIRTGTRRQDRMKARASSGARTPAGIHPQPAPKDRARRR